MVFKNTGGAQARRIDGSRELSKKQSRPEVVWHVEQAARLCVQLGYPLQVLLVLLLHREGARRGGQLVRRGKVLGKNSGGLAG